MRWFGVEVLTIVAGMDARKNDSGRVVFWKGSSPRIDEVLVKLALELSGMRDCGGVRESLDSLDRELVTSILAS